MSKYQSEIGAAGFDWHVQTRGGKALLLPTSLIHAIEAEASPQVEANADAGAMTAQAAVEETDRKPKKPKHGGVPLPEFRTPADALSLAKDLLSGVASPVLLPAHLSRAMLAAVMLQVSVDEPGEGMGAVFNYLVDPRWDSTRQMFTSLVKLAYFEKRPQPGWYKELQNELMATMSDRVGDMEDLAKAASAHWTAGLLKAEAGTKKLARTIQIFCPEAMDKAAVAVRELPTEKRAAGVRVLEQARAQDGQRALPDAAQASQNLEAKKLDFENLRAPIERLQTDLVLAQAMPDQEFRIAPLLLLGDPGIGKTYLASQLAQALGVPSAKMSAGGAQGAFQLSGSHSTWTSAKPGMVIELLAQSASASPVLVIDEVDKIHEDKHAFLPVLLDLLDAGTAKQFRDEYFEMDFDASRIIFVLTANSIDKVPPPLLSRVEVFHVPTPQPAQRLRIVQKIMADLVEKTGHPIAFAPGTAERLAERMDLDLRQIDRMARVAFAAALQAGDKLAKLPFPIDYAAFSLHAWTPEPEQKFS